MNGVSMLVGHDLELDVVRIDDQLLDVNVAVPKSLFRFGARGVKRGSESWLHCARRACRGHRRRRPP